tara:strand:- start:2023 stop:2184 length:162 start_codon:yes stop_codon:yes gene_type:complete
MNKQRNLRTTSIHLYNPKEEGLGKYDIHYINGYKKHKGGKSSTKIKQKMRYAA